MSAKDKEDNIFWFWFIVCLAVLLVLGGCSSIPPKYAKGETRTLIRSNGESEIVLIVGHGWRWIKGGNTLKVYEVETVDGSHLAAQEFQLK